MNDMNYNGQSIDVTPRRHQARDEKAAAKRARDKANSDPLADLHTTVASGQPDNAAPEATAQD